MSGDGPRAARDVPPGTPWIFREHRTVAEVWGLRAEAATQPRNCLDVAVPRVDPRLVPGLLRLADALQRCDRSAAVHRFVELQKLCPAADDGAAP